MAGSGPAPNPNSRRQSGNQAHTWTDLPAGGYQGKIPAWPLAPLMIDKLDLSAVHERELEVWSSVWRTPQAAAWQRNGWMHDVGLYVRYLVLGEGGNLDAAKEARMWSDRLGLSPAAMLKNRWRVSADQVTEKRESKKRPQRRRLVVADAVEA